MVAPWAGAENAGAMRSAVAELFGGGRGRVLAFCWLGWVFDFYDLILFAFVKVDIGRELGLAMADLAVIEGVTLACTAVGGFGFGRWADRAGRRVAITASIVLYSAGAFSTAFAGGFGSLLVARAVTGLGVGGEWGVGHAIVAETYPPHLRGRAAGVLQAGSPVAMAMAAAVASFSGLDWRTLFLLSAAPALLAFAARWALPMGGRAPRAATVPLLDLFRRIPLAANASILGLLVLHMTGFWCTYAWLPVRLRGDFVTGDSTGGMTNLAFIGWFFLGANAVHVFADVAFGYLADRFGRRRTFTAFSLAFACGLVLVGVGYDSLRAEPWLFMAAFALVGLGAGTWSCFGVLFAQNYPESLRATAASGFYNLARGAQLPSQLLMAYLFAATGEFAVALYVGAVTAVLSALVIWWVPRAETQDDQPSLPPSR